ncbi:hypothetical protein ACFX13_031178 [Malus domestica]
MAFLSRSHTLRNSRLSKTRVRNGGQSLPKRARPTFPNPGHLRMDNDRRDWHRDTAGIFTNTSMAAEDGAVTIYNCSAITDARKQAEPIFDEGRSCQDAPQIQRCLRSCELAQPEDGRRQRSSVLGGGEESVVRAPP